MSGKPERKYEDVLRVGRQMSNEQSAMIALYAIIRESEFGRTGKLPSDDWIRENMVWWLTHGVEIEKTREHSFLKPAAATPVTVEAPEIELQKTRKHVAALLVGIWPEDGFDTVEDVQAELKRLRATPKPIGDVEAVARKIYEASPVINGEVRPSFDEIVGILSPLFAPAGPAGLCPKCKSDTFYIECNRCDYDFMGNVFDVFKSFEAQPPCSECATLRKERDDAKRTAKLEMIERLNGWIGRVGHENYYKARAKLLEFETRAEAAEAQLSTLRDALRSIEELALACIDTHEYTCANMDGIQGIAEAALAPTPEVAK